MYPNLYAPTDTELAEVLPLPDTASHKYTRGVLGMLTGSDQYPGAALMSVRAAVNSGVGMVKFRGGAGLDTLLHLSVPEAVCVHQPATEVRADAWAVGSGVTGDSRLEETRALIATGQPTVIDAGAVNLAAQLVADGYSLTPASILTPHAGELEAFFTWTSALAPSLLDGLAAPTRAEIEARPAEWAHRAARLSGATVLLKGGTTHIASPGAERVLNIQGATPWLATADSGDTLTGVLGAFLAQHEVTRSQRTSVENDSVESLATNRYQYLAGAAARVHALAAEAVHELGRQGPVPPTLVAQHLPSAFAAFLAPTA